MGEREKFMVGVLCAVVMVRTVDGLDGWELREVRGTHGELFVELDDCTCGRLG
jgi:hypothetical protein